MLIMDGYGSHMTYEFFTYAKRNQIELFRLPPHSTHLTQPLDVGCFQPFKHYHSEGIDDGTTRRGRFRQTRLFVHFSAHAKSNIHLGHYIIVIQKHGFGALQSRCGNSKVGGHSDPKTCYPAPTFVSPIARQNAPYD